MNRKWLAFPLSAGILIVIGIVAGPSLLRADDEESPLGKLMEKVNKNNSTITKGVRNKVNYAKSRKDVVKSAKDFVKLGKDAKSMKDAFKKAKVADPQKKWEEYIERFIKTSQDLADVTAKESTGQVEAKAAFQKVSKACADCHTDFRVDEGGF